MARVITIPDEIYERLAQAAASQHEAIADMLVHWLDGWFDQGQLVYSSKAGPRSIWTLGFLRGLGLDEELIAHVLAAPEEKRGRVLRLALTALADEQSERDRVQEPRHQSFEQFFRELGMTDEQIAEAQRRGAERANL